MIPATLKAVTMKASIPFLRFLHADTSRIEQQDGQGFAALVPLERLNRCPLDSDTRANVEEVNEYADLVLGEKWRGTKG